MLRLILGLCAAVLFAGSALAQAYPAKPIRLVVGYTPGGGNDLIARIVAAKLQDKLGQPVVVDNKPGAQSIVAAEIVAKAAPDGYTLLIAPSGPMTINPAVYSKLPYDPVKDFAPVSLLAEFPLLLAVGAEQPVKSVTELVEFARANPKLANYASSATPFQLAGELFNQRTGSSFQHIPYRGSGDAVQAVVAGQVLMTISDFGPDGRTAERRQAARAAPSPRPSGRPPFPTCRPSPSRASPTWRSSCGPASSRRPARPPRSSSVCRTRSATRSTCRRCATALEAINVDPRATTVAEFRELIARDAARWKAVAAKANIKLD